MKPILLHQSAILSPGTAYHLTRATLVSERPRALHAHDFHELLWVQNGVLRHYDTSGHQDLPEGAVVFLRPGDQHGLQAKAEETLVVSLSIQSELIDALGDRHDNLRGHFFWSTDQMPAIRHRDIRQLVALNHAALRLERSARTPLELEAFLLPLLTDMLDGATDHSGMPAWLAQACAAAEDPKVFREGAAGFARVAGRAHPHVSRTTRKFLGQSPSDYINARRMAFAARRLSGSTDSLAEIAGDCGIPNLSHFHKLFREHHGKTPQKYRKSHQRDVVQPVR